MVEKIYDIIAIGAGSGGLNIAMFMHKAGFKVLLIDKSDANIGGDCLNFGCVPSKALIHVSKLVHHGKKAEKFGVKQKEGVDIKKVMKYIKEKQSIIRKHENAKHFRELGIDIELGSAEFTGKHEIKVNGKLYRSKKIIIATGSRPKKLNIPGMEKIENMYSNETIFNIKKLPKRLVIIGAGPIGIELGQAFSRLGSKTIIVQRGSQFLEKEELEVSKLLKNILIEEGIKIHLDCSPIKVIGKNKILVQSKDEGNIELEFDGLLVATGRDLNIPQGLEKAGIDLEDNGKKIKVDEYLRTTNKDVLLCGDIVGSHKFTHAAELHAGVILTNFFSPFKKKLSNDNLSWVTYTDPEVATFGLSQKQLDNRGINYQRLTQDYSEVDRGITDNAEGNAIIYISKNKLLGGTLIAPNAGEIFQELILANSSRLDIKNIFNKIYPYPTASRINKKIITQLFSEKLTEFNKKVLRFLFKF